MRILRSVQHKYCADGSYMKEYVLDEPMTKEFFEYLKYFGRVEQMENLGSGFYKFDKPDFFSIKGFAGDDSVEVRFKAEVMDMTSSFLIMLFSQFKGESSDIAALKKRETPLVLRVKEQLYGKQSL